MDSQDNDTGEKVVCSGVCLYVLKNEKNFEQFKEYITHASREAGSDVELFSKALYAAAACLVRTKG